MAAARPRGTAEDYTPHPSSYDLSICRCFETWDELSPRTWEAFEGFFVDEDRAKENSPDERKELGDDDYKKGIYLSKFLRVENNRAATSLF